MFKRTPTLSILHSSQLSFSTDFYDSQTLQSQQHNTPEGKV